MVVFNPIQTSDRNGHIKTLIPTDFFLKDMLVFLIINGKHKENKVLPSLCCIHTDLNFEILE